jgi:putative ABC transport system permease protein
MVVFQFTITIALLSAVLITFRQLAYVRDIDLGFDEESMVSALVPGGAGQASALREAWMRLPGVMDVTADARRSADGAVRRLVARENDTSYVWVNQFDVAENYTHVMDIDVVHGRAFSADFVRDTVDVVLINEAAARAVGWRPEEAVGQRLQFFRNQWEVVGVTRDFHHSSLYKEVEPLMMQWRPAAANRLLVRVQPAQIPPTLAAMEAAWRQHVPERPFAYAFLDEVLGRLYEADRRLGRFFGAFAALAVLIACLGLFGLASYAAQQRTKEIGIRKVFGATEGGIVLLFSKEFVVLVGVAFVLAVPVAYLGMSRWLEHFAYRVEPGWAAFVGSGLAALFIALLTVGYQAVRAARANPVQALRHE